MKAKTLNLSSPFFTKTFVTGEGRYSSSSRLVFAKLTHNGSNFEVAEAYIAIEKRIEEGTVAEHLGFLNEIMNKWYNASIEPEGRFIVANGYISMIGNYEYTDQLEELKERVAYNPTRKQREAVANAAYKAKLALLKEKNLKS